MCVLLVKRDDAGEPSLEGMALSATQAVNNHEKKHSNAMGTMEHGGKSLLSQAILVGSATERQEQIHAPGDAATSSSCSVGEEIGYLRSAA